MNNDCSYMHIGPVLGLHTEEARHSHVIRSLNEIPDS